MKVVLSALVGVAVVWAAIAFANSSAPLKATSPKTYEEAITYAKSSGKPVLVDFHAEWCSACHYLESEVYTDPRVAKALDGLSFVRVDVDKEGKDLARKHNVTSLPTLLFLTAEGKVINRIDGAPPAAALVDQIEAVKKAISKA